MRAAVMLNLALLSVARSPVLTGDVGFPGLDTATLALPAPAHHNPHAHGSDTDQCGESPYIHIWDIVLEAYIYNSDKDNRDNVSIPNGTSVEVRCSCEDWSQNVRLTRHGEQLESHKDELIIGNEKTYNFECTIVETGCKHSINISITPNLEVRSPNISAVADWKHGRVNYTVMYGESVSVSCRGPDAGRLVLAREGAPAPAARESDSSVKLEWTARDLQAAESVCTDVATNATSTVMIIVVPTIYFLSQNKTIAPYNTYFNGQYDSVPTYIFEYRDSFEVFCSGPRAVKFIGDLWYGNTSLVAENVNKTTAFIRIPMLELRTWEFTCSDNEFSDFVKKIRVEFIPRLEILSPSARFVGKYEQINNDYTVMYGEPLELICYGPYVSGNLLQVYVKDITGEQKVNETSVKLIISRPNWSEFKDIRCSQGYGIEARVAILPAVADLNCISHGGIKINCTWTAMNEHVNSTLYYVENGKLTQICHRPPSSETYKFCVWDYEYIISDIEVFNLTIQSCSGVGCNNQTMDIDHPSIVKLAAPKEWKIWKKTSRNASLFGHFVHQCFAGKCRPPEYNYHHKIQYWYSGIEPREVNSSLVICERYVCRIELQLPCPGKFYEIWLYHKLKEAVGEQFWSDPAILTVTTEKDEDNADIVDSTCNQTTVEKKEVMAYFARIEKEKALAELKLIKKIVNALKDQRAMIREYLSSPSKVATLIKKYGTSPIDNVNPDSL